VFDSEEFRGEYSSRRAGLHEQTRQLDSFFSRRLYLARQPQHHHEVRDRPYVTILKSVPATPETRTYPEVFAPPVRKDWRGASLSWVSSLKFQVSSWQGGLET
jgi:hypothetical protein